MPSILAGHGWALFAYLLPDKPSACASFLVTLAKVPHSQLEGYLQKLSFSLH